MNNVTVGARDGHTCDLGIFFKRISQLVTKRATSLNLNFGAKQNYLLPLGREWTTICHGIDLSLVNLKITTSHLSVFESGSEGGCNMSNKMSGIFLWPCIWLFLSWYEQPHLIAISLSWFCLCQFSFGYVQYYTI